MPIVVNNQARFHNLGDIVVLKPGVNDVPDVVWDEALEIAAVRTMVEDKTFTVEKRSLKDLSRLKPADAAELVKVTYDKELLAKWAAAEKRRAISDLIAAQVDAVTPKAPAVDGVKSKDQAQGDAE